MLLPKLLLCLTASVFLYSCKKDGGKDPAWTRIANFPEVGRQNAISFVIGSRVFVGLGEEGPPQDPYKDFWEYDAVQNQWTKRATFPGVARSAPTGFVIGEKGYVVNGVCNCKDFWEYDPATDSWAQKADFPIADAYYTVPFVIDGKAYVGTGSYTGGIYEPRMLNEFWKYDPAVDMWTTISSLPREAVSMATGFTLNGKGYIATGIQMAGSSQELWEYSPVNDSWNKRANFIAPAEGLISFVHNDKAYVGYGSDIWQYDPGKDVWQQYAKINGGFYTGAVSFVVNGSAYVGLGSPAWTIYTPEFWKIDLK